MSEIARKSEIILYQAEVIDISGKKYFPAVMRRW